MSDFNKLDPEQTRYVVREFSETIDKKLDCAQRVRNIDGHKPDLLILKYAKQLYLGAPFEEVEKAYVRDRENYPKDL